MTPDKILQLTSKGLVVEHYVIRRSDYSYIDVDDPSIDNDPNFSDEPPTAIRPAGSKTKSSGAGAVQSHENEARIAELQAKYDESKALVEKGLELATSKDAQIEELINKNKELSAKVNALSKDKDAKIAELEEALAAERTLPSAPSTPPPLASDDSALLTKIAALEDELSQVRKDLAEAQALSTSGTAVANAVIQAKPINDVTIATCGLSDKVMGALEKKLKYTPETPVSKVYEDHQNGVFDAKRINRECQIELLSLIVKCMPQATIVSAEQPPASAPSTAPSDSTVPEGLTPPSWEEIKAAAERRSNSEKELLATAANLEKLVKAARDTLASEERARDGLPPEANKAQRQLADVKVRNAKEQLQQNIEEFNATRQTAALAGAQVQAFLHTLGVDHRSYSQTKSVEISITRHLQKIKAQNDD